MFHTFFGAVLAGIAIGIGGTVFLSVESSIIGSVLFSIGLYAICAHGLFLFTGKIGYLIDKTVRPLELLIIWIGNLVGTGITAAFVRLSRISGISELAASMCAVKINDNIFSLLLLAVCCGFLMFVAVDGYKKTSNPLILLMCVSAFILCGFEHCIADMYYFSVSLTWNAASVLRIIMITAGNAIGAFAVPLFRKIQPKV